MRPRGEQERTRVSIPAATPPRRRHTLRGSSPPFEWTPGGTERFLGRDAIVRRSLSSLSGSGPDPVVRFGPAAALVGTHWREINERTIPTPNDVWLRR